MGVSFCEISYSVTVYNVLFAVYINSKNFCCFTQTTTPTRQPPRQVAGKGDKQLVEQQIQQIEQLRNEGLAKDRGIAEVKKQNADLQMALRNERLQRENAVSRERREKKALQQRLHYQGQQIVELRQP